MECGVPTCRHHRVCIHMSIELAHRIGKAPCMCKTVFKTACAGRAQYCCILEPGSPLCGVSRGGGGERENGFNSAVGIAESTTLPMMIACGVARGRKSPIPPLTVTACARTVRTPDDKRSHGNRCCVLLTCEKHARQAADSFLQRSGSMCLNPDL